MADIAPTRSTVVHRHAGPVHVLDSPIRAREMERAFVAALGRNGSVVGFDMEWLPDRCPQHNHKVALVQLAVGHEVWLVRTCKLRSMLPEFVRKVLINPSIIKLAIDFSSADCSKLKHSFGIAMEEDVERYGILDLSVVAKACGIQGYGLKKLAARYGYHLDKNKKVSCSNWEANRLSSAQVNYAAGDAYFTLLIADHLLNEEAALHKVSALQTHAAARCRAAAAEARVGLQEEDNSAKVAAIQDLVADLWSQLIEQGPMPLSATQFMSPIRRAQQLGLSTGKDFFREHWELFAVQQKKDDILVCPRSLRERQPPIEESFNLPWASDTEAALARWLDLERADTGADEPLSHGQLKHRLVAVARELDRRKLPEAAVAIQKLVSKGVTLAPPAQSKTSGTEVAGTASTQVDASVAGASQSGKLEGARVASKVSVKDGLAASAPKGTRNELFIAGLPTHWDSARVCQAITEALGHAVQKVKVPPRKSASCAHRGFAFVALADGYSIDTILGNADETTISLDGEFVRARKAQ